MLTLKDIRKGRVTDIKLIWVLFVSVHLKVPYPLRLNTSLKLKIENGCYAYQKL